MVRRYPLGTTVGKQYENSHSALLEHQRPLLVVWPKVVQTWKARARHVSSEQAATYEASHLPVNGREHLLQSEE